MNNHFLEGYPSLTLAGAGLLESRGSGLSLLKNLHSVLKISYADCLGLSPAISAQLTLKMHVAAQNHEKFTKTSYFGGSRSSMLTFLRNSSLVLVMLSSMSAYLQPFSR